MHQQQKKTFIDEFSGLTLIRDRGTAFTDWLEISSIAMHQLPYNCGSLAKDEDYERLEANYFDRIKPYNPDELQVMGKLLAITITSLSQGFSDFLGSLFMEMEMGNSANGQFFTPYEVSKMMAMMSLDKLESVVREKGIATLSDPACGAGGTLIAGADIALSKGIDPRKYMHFDAIDISRNCFNMTYIQMSVLGLQAVVRHGDTIRMKMWEERQTYQWKLFSKWECMNPGNATDARINRFKALLEYMPEEIATATEAQIIMNQPERYTQLSLF